MALKDWKKISSSDIWIVWKNKRNKKHLVSVAKGTNFSGEPKSKRWKISAGDNTSNLINKHGLYKKDALKYAKSYMKTKRKTTLKNKVRAKSSYQILVYPKRTRPYHLAIDKTRTAKKVGVRKSDKTGRVYTERRENRSDKNRRTRL